MVHGTKEVLNIQVDHIAKSKSVQFLNPMGRLPRTAAWTEAITALEERFLEGWAELLVNSLLTYSVCDDGNPERAPFLAAQLRYIDPPYRLASIPVLK
jgi:hypothetical protein